jgi:hypothetical protein
VLNAGWDYPVPLPKTVENYVAVFSCANGFSEELVMRG